MEVIEELGASKPWFDGEVVERITVRDKLKIKFSKSKLQIDHDNFKNAQKQASQIIKWEKLKYIKNELRDNIAKSSKLWKTLKSIGLPKKGKNEIFFEPKDVSRIFKSFMKILLNINYQHHQINLIMKQVNYIMII